MTTTRAQLRQEKPESLPKFLELVEQSQQSAPGALWYRGCPNNSFQLLPTLYRNKRAKKQEDLAELERQLMARFRQRSLPYITRSLSDDWETLFFMQHYGVPTRLLDWTENPLTALYFALVDAEHKTSSRGNMTFTRSVAVWILDPITWNRHALSHQSYDGGPLTPGDEALKGYKPNITFAGMNNQPVAIYGSHNSARIVAQRGVFTIFGQNISPMEEIYKSFAFPPDCLLKVTIQKTLIKAMRKSLLNHYITESVVFPDLDGLAREIKRVFGFER